MEEILSRQAGPGGETPIITVAPQQEVPVSARMRSSFNRVGFGTLTAFQVGNAVGAIGLYVGMLVAMFVTGTIDLLVSGDGSLGLFGDGMEAFLRVLAEKHVVLYGLLAYLILYAAGLLGGYLVQRRMLRRNACGRPEKRKLSAGHFLLTLLAAFGLWGVGALVGNIGELFGYASEGMETYYGIFGTDILPYLLYAVLVAPVLEELIFRKAILDATHGYGQVTAMLASALLFGLAHRNSGQFFLAFLLGLLFAAVYMQTGNILYTMVMHAAINLLASLPGILAVLDITEIGWLRVDPLFLIIYHVLIVAGLVVLAVCGKRIFGGLTTTAMAAPQADAWHTAFRPAGMRLFVIFNLVQLVAMDLLSFASALVTTWEAGTLIMLLPTVLAVLTCLLVPRCVLKKRKAAAVADAPADGQ